MAKGGMAVAALAWTSTLFGITMVVFGFLALIVNINSQEMRVELQNLRARYADMIKAEEEALPAYTELRNIAQTEGANRSLFGVMQDELGWLRQRIDGQPNSSKASIQTTMDTLNIPSNRTLIDEIRNLRVNLDAEKLAYQKLEQDFTAQQDRATAQEREKIELKRQFERSLAALEQQQQTVREDYDKFRSRVREDQQRLESRIVEVRNSQVAALNSKDAIISEKESEVNRLNNEIQSLKRDLGKRTSTGVDPREMPDGQIASIVSDENLVYINRGRADRIQLGMTFAVFDNNRVIRLNNYGELEGKARIEVITITETSALCRVISVRPGAVLSEGDVIANVVYDPEAIFRFYVHGSFDIDNTGLATDSDRRRIENMVRQWGGRLAQPTTAGQLQLSFDVDYLVLGVAPAFPGPLDDSVIDPEVIEQHSAAIRKYEDYQNLVGQANTLQIPVLNQNRFLRLVGYYKR